jgi:cell cycle protein kinase DBF2
MAAGDFAAESPSKLGALQLPNPPPLLHTRASQENYDRPSTPTHNPNEFTSPMQTPVGSPSKNKLPPGALNLPGVFDKAMKLAPSSPTKSVFGTPGSPGKGLSVLEDFNGSVLHQDPYSSAPGSPTRRSNKENNPPNVPRLGKDLGLNANSAAVSRLEQYQQRDMESVRRAQNQTLRGLTPEEIEKLQLPKVKRLANVTQLCKLVTAIEWLYLGEYCVLTLA